VSSTDCYSFKEILRLNVEPRFSGVSEWDGNPTYIFDKIINLTISADDTLLASNSDNGYIRIWNLITKKLLCCQSAHKDG